MNIEQITQDLTQARHELAEHESMLPQDRIHESKARISVRERQIVMDRLHVTTLEENLAAAKQGPEAFNSLINSRVRAAMPKDAATH